MSATPSVRIGLIGCGGRIRGVAKHLLDSPLGSRVAITAMYDPYDWAVRETQSYLGTAAQVYDSLESLLRDSGVDWVMIGSFNSLHVDQAVAALAAGKHVFCEKPLATSLADCVLLCAALAAAPDRHFFFGLVLRYVPLYRKVKELFATGVLGRVISFEFNETVAFNHGGYIHGNWRRDRALAGTHVLEKCCHDYDIVNWLLGSLPVRAASFGGTDIFRPENRPLAERLGTDAKGNLAYQSWPDPLRVDPFSPGNTVVDNQVAILEYASGARATFHTNCNAAILERRMYFCGTEGTLRVDAITGVIEVQRIGFDTKPEVIHVNESSEGHLGGDSRMAAHLARTMLEGAAPEATLEDGVRSAISCFGVDAAHDTGRVVDLRPMWQQAGITP